MRKKQSKTYREKYMKELKSDPLRHQEYLNYHRRWQRKNRKEIQRKQNERNRSRKLALVQAFGGKCCRCAYSKCVSALEFHHSDPSVKENTIASLRTLDKAHREASKCELVCANCHREIHEIKSACTGRPTIE